MRGGGGVGWKGGKLVNKREWERDTRDGAKGAEEAEAGAGAGAEAEAPCRILAESPPQWPGERGCAWVNKGGMPNTKGAAGAHLTRVMEPKELRMPHPTHEPLLQAKRT